MKLSGSLRSEFGVCTNEWSPADGRVVHLDFGCGAHSETGQEEDGEHEIPRGGGVIVDELDVEVVADGGNEARTDDATAENAAADADTTGDADKTADAPPAEESPSAAAPSADEVPEADSPED
jgi:hypothetical protein